MSLYAEIVSQLQDDEDTLRKPAVEVEDDVDDSSVRTVIAMARRGVSSCECTCLLCEHVRH